MPRPPTITARRRIRRTLRALRRSRICANVGTIVEELDDSMVLVEFSDDDGRPYAVAPCRRSELPTLHYAPEAA
ncbi:DUF4926 domain-containing protein [Bradyrhizobium sp. 521_C7_N1_3]|uniref:DUF4926 domain-containing protein n=1 Tax=Bradyrhizobium sp. 521_C7_N1_3 TaxID=3240368 RepID=UPI003F8A79AD